MTATAPIRALSLDIWGTLLKSDPRFKPARNEVFRDLLAPSVSLDAFDQALREADRHADALMLSTGHDLGLTPRVLRTLDSLHIPRPDQRTLESLPTAQDSLARQYHPLPINPADIKALEHFVTHHGPIAVTSNTGMLPGALMRDLLALTGFTMIHVHVFSNEIADLPTRPTDHAKPYPTIFETTFRALAADPESVEGLRRDQVLHIGDNYVADYAGACAYGLRAAHIAPTREGGDTVADVLSSL